MPAAVENDQVFSGLRVLDLSRWVAGEFATKLLADFGADVIKIEKPGVGSLTRQWGPFPHDVPDPERSALFLHLNTNKRSLGLDLTSAEGRQLLLGLVARADVLVESFRPGHLERLGLGPEILHAANPRLVITRITAFGQDGPYRDFEATGLVLQAMGGPMHSTGDGHRAPQRKPGNLENYSIGRAAAEGALAGLINVRRHGTGSVIDVSGQEVLLSGGDRRASYLLAASYAATDAPRGIRSAHRGQSKFTGPFKAKDGYVVIYITNQVFWDRFVDQISEPDSAFHKKYFGTQIRAEDWEEFRGYVADWFARRPKVQIMEDGEAVKIPVTAFLEIHELMEHRHFRERGVFGSADHPAAGRLEYIGAPWRMRDGYRLRRTAPLLDEHGDEIRAELDQTSSAAALQPIDWPSTPVESPAHTAPGQHLPLDGIRIVDLTVVWAGPGGTALLGDLGAEVIRIEGNNRIARQASAKYTKQSMAGTGYSAAMFPDRDPQPRPYDRSAVFNWHSRNKLAVSGNLETPEGHDAIIELIKISDVFIENNSAGTLEKLGLGHEELLAINPRLIVVRMPPMGLTGPMSTYLGYGPNFNALIGIAAMDGYEGETPDTAGDNYHMDEATPTGVAMAVLAALWDRERTGTGGLVEFAQSENVMQDIGEFVLDRQMNQRNPAIIGNTDPYLLQDVFPCREDDRWIAVSIRHDADWAALRSVVGDAPWLAAGDTGAQRTENSVELRRELAAWTRDQSSAEVLAALRARNVPAGEVMSETRLLEDPHLIERDWFKLRTHPNVGTHHYPGHPWRAEGFDTVYGRPVPAFGEDNEYVYKQLLGYSDAQYDSLVERKLISDEQFA
jgi:crotonobetainyl-CoA:carnitine CoA-transferase CaiB-like acyl-CoA transferase